MAPDLEHVLRSVDLDAETRRGRERLRFSRPMEQAFLTDTVEWRRKHFRRTALMGLISYNVFLLIDAILVRDAIVLSLTLHLMVVSPIMVLLAMLLSRPRSVRAVELIGAAMPLIFLAQVEAVFMVSRAPEADHYQYCAIFTVMFANAVLRLRFHYAVVVSLIIVAVHALVAFTSPNLTGPAAFMAAMGVIGASYITLLSNAIQEREYRRSWLVRRSAELRATELSRDNAKLSQLSRVDPLTGVANRRGFELSVEQFMAQQTSRDTPFCIIMLDVDHFKSYNDTYGHAAGDACLHMMAQVMGESVRGDHDVLARFGGEEFVIFVAHCHLNEGAMMAERIRRAVVAAGMPHARKDGGCVVTVSLGVAEGRLSGAAALREIMAHADAALYDAKNGGRNRVEPPPQPRAGFMIEDVMPATATAELF